MQSMSSLSLEYVLVAVTVTVNSAVYNPSTDSVQFAFPAIGADPAVWYSGSWDSSPVPGTSTYTARCLVGPGGTVTLTKGQYAIWLKITDSPEIPVRNVDLLTIT